MDAGSKAELIDRVLTHVRGNLSARDAVEDEESLIIHAKHGGRLLGLLPTPLKTERFRP